MGRTRIAKALISSLSQKKDSSQKRKNELIDYLKRLNQAHADKKISGAQYIETLYKKNNGRNIKEWVEYYDNYSKNCEKAIQRQKTQLIRNRTLALFFGVILLTGFIWVAFSINYSNIHFTGLFVGEPQQQEYSQIIGLVSNESTTYEWQVENSGQLSSVKINGDLIGEGEVKIYLGDLLILDSSNIKSKSKKSVLTGSVVEELSETGTSDAETETETTTTESYSEQETPSQEESSPSQEESLSENTEEQDSESQISQTSNSEEQTENEAPSQEAVQDSSQEEPQTSENITEPTNESYSEQETPSQEESSPSQEEPLPETNESTVNQTIETNKTEIEMEIPVKEFIDICEETCDVGKLNLTDLSYTLRIEVSGNATLRVGSIDYSILQEQLQGPIQEIPTNLTENITINTTQYQAVLGQPVKWKKQISLKESGPTRVELPKDATNIVVNKISDSYSEGVNEEVLPKEESSPSQGESLPSEKETKEIKERAKATIEIKTREEIQKDIEIENKKSPTPSLGITGQAISEPQQDISNSSEEVIEVLIDDNATLYEVEYETSAPYAIEEENENGKKVVIAGPDTTHYEDVLVFTTLNESLNLINPSELKIYWVEENTYLSPTLVQDKNSNEIYDYVEWIVPHLSNQTFNLTIQPGTEGKDAHIDSATQNRNYGASDLMIISNTERMLLEFNLSSVTSAANIVNANLTLYLDSSGTGTNPITVQRVNQSWIEGTGTGQTTYDGVTWNNRSGSELWDIAGGDFDPFVWTTTNISTVGTYYTWDITELVQNWVNGTYPNYGIILKGENGHGQWHFASSDNIDSAIWPQLNITYNESEIPVVNSVSMPSTIREGENISLIANISDNLQVANAAIEIDGQNYSLGQNPLTVSDIATIRPVAKGTIETNKVLNYPNTYDNNNDTFAAVNDITSLLTVKTPGASATGTINSVKIKIVHSKLNYNTTGYVHWASSNGGDAQGLTHEFNSTSETPEITEFDVTSERDWTFADFNLLSEIHINSSGNTLRVYEVWFEVNYTTPASNDLWNSTIDTSELTQGNYTYTIYANDSSDNVGVGQGNLNVLPQLVLVNVSVNDAQGNFKEAEVLIYDENQEVEMNSTMTEAQLISVEEGQKDIIINPVDSSVTKINYTGTLIENYTDGIIDIDENITEKGNFTKLYALNPHLTTNATVNVRATGEELYKCKDWNFTNQSCDGEWIKVMDLTPGEEYNLTLSPEDPGFAEFIRVVSAYHLDSNRTAISDIYGDIKELDDNWSETIPDGDYVRITFELPLQNINDITLYPRVVSGTPKIEVYELNQTKKIAEFNPLFSNEYNKVFLINLEGLQDTFDLKVVGGDLELDHIVDPTTVYNMTPDHRAYWGQPTSSNRWLAGTNATQTQYTNMGSENSVYADNTMAGGTNNDYPFWRFNFTIAEDPTSITSLSVKFTGYENATGGGETATLYMWRFVNSTWMPIGTLNQGSNSNLTRTITSDASSYIDSNNQTVLVVEGSSFDAGDAIRVDHVQLTVQTIEDTSAPNITFEAPTPGNGSTKPSPVTIVANISDESETSSWIDFDRTLVGYWAMDFYNTTHVFDNSSYKNNASFEGGLTSSGISSASRGNGLAFPGDYEYLHVGQRPSLNLSSNFTISFWVNPATVTKSTYGDHIISDCDSSGSLLQYAVLINYDAGRVASMWGDQYTGRTNTTLSTGTWYHIAVIRSGSPGSWKTYFYVNGALDNTNTSSTNPSDQQGLSIGQAGELDDLHFTGSLDEVMIFNRTLSSTEVAALYSSKSNKFNTSEMNLADGQYNYTVYAIDRYGFTNNSGLMTFNVAEDTNPPTITFEPPTPDNASTTQSPVTIVANITDPEGTNTSTWMDLDRTLLAYWPMDYYNGTGIYDNSTYNNFGRFIGGVNYSNLTTGKRGNGLKFDGVDDSINSSILNFQNFTLAAWVKPGAQSGERTIINKYLVVALEKNYQAPDTNLNCLFGDGSSWAYGNLISTSAYNQDQWNYMACSYNGTHMLVYLNGESTFYEVTSGGSNSYPIQLARGWAGGYEFNGSLDEVMIYNRGLFPQELDALYSSQINKFNTSEMNLADGQYNYTVYAIDEAGNINDSGERTFTVGEDSTPPTIIFEEDPPTPANGSTTTSPVTIVANISDDSNTSSWIDFDRDLLGYWSMDYYNTTGIYDNSTYANNGTFQGFAFGTSNITTGMMGEGLEFDQVDDWVSIPGGTYLPAGNQSRTMSVWFIKRANMSNNSMGIFAYGVGSDNDLFGLIINRNESFSVYDPNELIVDNYYGTTQNFGTNYIILNDVWYHAVATYNTNDGNISVYINGTLVASDVGRDYTTSTSSVRIGRTFYTGVSSFNGTIDEVMLFNRTLSPTEVKALYNSKVNKFNTSSLDLADGQHNYTVYAVDANGNINNSGERNFVVTSGAADCTTIGNSGVLDSVGQTYTLTENITSDGTCLFVTAANVTLDCNGYWINYSINGTDNQYGVFTNQFNTTVKNCNIVDGNWSAGTGTARHGIYFNTADNGTIFNNYVSVNNSYGIFLYDETNFNNLTNNYIISNRSFGLYLNSAQNNTLVSNRMIIGGANSALVLMVSSDNTLINNTAENLGSGNGILIQVSSYNNLTNNTGIGDTSQGIRLVSSSYNNFTNNTAISSTNYALQLQDSLNNIFIYPTARTIGTTGSGRNAIYIDGANNSIFRDCINVSGASSDISYSVFSNGINNTFINCSYDTSKETLPLAGDELIRKWYYQAYVNYSNGTDAVGVNITAYNSTGSIQFTAQTNSTGMIGRQEIIEYNNTGGTRSFYNNYTITANKSGVLANDSNEFNFTITQNKVDDVFTLQVQDYFLRIINPTTANPLSVSSGDNISIYFNFSLGDTNITSGVGIDSVFVGGTEATILGEPLDLTSSSCGNDCSGGTYEWGYYSEICTNYNLAGACTPPDDCDGTNAVVDIWLNGTTFAAGDSVNVTIQVNCWDSANEISLLYYNGTGWNQIFYEADCAYTQATGNYSAVFKINSTASTQYIRGQLMETDLSYGWECVEGSFFGEYDDIAFDVVEAGQQFDYITNVGWQVNATMPDFTGGPKDLFVNATYGAFTRNDTQTNAIDYGEADCTTIGNSGDLDSVNGLYTLTGNITSDGTCLTVTATNVTLDCNGYWINYSIGGTSGNYGVYTDRFNTTIKNCNVVDGNWTSSTQYRHGIYLDGSSNSTLRNNYVNVSNGYAIYLYSSLNSTLINNTGASDSQRGIILYRSHNNNVTNNTGISNTYYAFGLNNASNNTLEDNSAISGDHAALLIQTSCFNNVFISNNATSTSSSAIYFEDYSNNNILIGNNGTSFGDGYGILFDDCLNETLFNNFGASDQTYGIYFSNTSNNNVTSNTGIGNVGRAIYFYESDNNTIESNTGTSQQNDGIYLAYSTNNTLISNNGTALKNNYGITIHSSHNGTLLNNLGAANASFGIYLTNASNTNLTLNTASSNSSEGFYIDNSPNTTLLYNNGSSISGLGIYMVSSDNSNLTNNIFTSNENGGFEFSGSSNCTLMNNTGISRGSLIGIYIDSSDNLTLINNNGTSATYIGIALWKSADNTLINNTGTGSYGLYLGSNSYNNTYINNTGISPDYHAVHIGDSPNNTFINQVARTISTSGYAVYIDSSNGTLFRDCINVSGYDYNVYYEDASGSFNNTFINCSYNTAKEAVQGTGSELIRKWYYMAYVNDSFGSLIEDVNVTAYNATGQVQFTAQTNSSGLIDKKEIIEYINRVGTRSFYSNYTIIANKSGYINDSNEFNFTITQNKVNDFFTLTAEGVDPNPPTITFEAPTPGNGSTTPDPVTIVANITDPEGTNTSAWMDLDRTLLAYWSMDYYNGTGIYDNSTYNNFGLFSGGVNYSNLTTGKRGSALKFDGSDDGINSSILNFQNFTLAAWVKPGAQSGERAIVGKYYVVYLETYEGVTLCGYGDGSGWASYFVSTNSYNQDQWNYMACTYNGTQYTIYLNGVANSVEASSGGSNSYPIYLATGPPAGYEFNGSLDEVMIFNRSLSLEELDALYSSQINKFNTSEMNLTDGQHNYTIYAIDEAGNINNSGERNFIVGEDSTPPTITFEEPPTPTNGSSTNSPVTIAANISDESETSSWVDLDRDLLGYWSMDYYNGTGIYDNSTYNHLASYVGGINYSNLSTGMRGQGLNFDQINDRLSIPGGNYLPVGDQSRTISIWFIKRANMSNNSMGIFAYGTNSDNKLFGLIINRNESFSVYDPNELIVDNYFSTTQNFGTNYIILNDVWYHAVATYNSSDGNISVYINGTLIASENGRNYDTSNSSGRIGMTFYSGVSSFNGTLDEAMIFNRTLSPTEVKALYNSQINKFNASSLDLAEEQHNYTVYAIDANGNINNSGERNFVVGVGDVLQIINPTTIDPLTVHSGNNISIYFNYSQWGVNVTSGVTIDSVLIGGASATILGGTGDKSYTTFSEDITTGTDDAEEQLVDNSVYTTGSSDLEITYDDGYGTNQYVGLRFQTVNIPQGATIESAVLEFSSDGEGQSGAGSVTIWGEAIDNAPTFSTASSNITSRTFTSNYSSWTFGGSWGAAGTRQNSSDLSNVIQEIVDRPGWDANHNLVLMINSSLSSGTNSRVAESYDKTGGTKANIATLYINYSTSSSPDPEFAYVTGVGWQVNVTVPDFADGLKDLFVNATYGAFTRNDTQTNAIDYGEADCTTIGNSGVLDSVNGLYTLTENISSNGTCLFVTAANVTLDCNGYWINYSMNGTDTQYGVYTDQFNTTVKNCNIVDGNWSTGTGTARHGIYFNTADNGTIFNNYVNVNNSYAIFLYNGANFNNLTLNTGMSNFDRAIVVGSSSNNILTSNNATGIMGLSLSTASNNNLTDNNGTSLSNGPGLRVSSSSENNTITNCIGTSDSEYGINVDSSFGNVFIGSTGISDSGFGIYVDTSINTTFINSTARCTSSMAIYVDTSLNTTFINQNSTGLSPGSRGVYIGYYSNNTLFRDCVNISGIDYDVYVSTTTGPILNSTFINCSYSTAKEGGLSSPSYLIRKWYYMAYVNDTLGNLIEDVNITAYNSTGAIQFTAQTNASGLIDKKEIIEYINTGGTRSFYNNYTITANKSEYINDSNEFNFTITQNKVNDFFTLTGDETPPTITFEEPPTPLNGSTVRYPKETIVANVSDSSSGNTSAWIDFDRSLVGYWAMDYYNTTDIFDNSTYRNNGTFNGGLNYTNLTTGARGKGLTFDGSDDYLDFNSPISMTDGTISMWVKWTDKTSPLSGVDITEGYWLYWESGHLYINWGNDPQEFTDVFSTDVWTYVTITKQGRILSLYKDGDLSEAIDIETTNTAAIRCIGYLYCDGSGSYQKFNGTLDELLIFNRTLSDEEIKAIYNAQANKFNTTFRELSNGQHNYTVYAVDASGNTNNSEERDFIIADKTEDVSPNITFEEDPPTPTNGSTTSSNVTIVANISDASNVSSWIDLDRSLVGYWAMDYYNTTDVFDNSTYVNNGTFSGDVFGVNNLTNGPRGYAFEFDGLDDRLNVSDLDLSNTDEISISFWFESESDSGDNAQVIGEHSVSYGSNNAFVVDVNDSTAGQDGRILFADHNSGMNVVYTSNSYQDGNWHHVVGIINRSAGSSEITIYVDGLNDSVQHPSYVADNDGNFGDYPFFFGGRGTGEFSFNGSIDEFMIFGRAISESEVLALYDSQSNKFNTSEMNLAVGQHNYTVYAIDESGNINNSGERNFIVTSGVADCTTIGNSGVLDSANGLYTLTENISSDGTCLFVTAVNVTIDCNGFWMNYSINGTNNQYGVYSDQFNTTIENCNIVDGDRASSNSARYGIYFDGNDNSTIQNNYLNTSKSPAIYLYNAANNNTLTNNIAMSSTSTAIYIYSSSSYNTLINNTGISYVTDEAGISLYTSSNNNKLVNNTGINYADGYGIFIGLSSKNNLTLNTGFSSSYEGITLSSSHNNTLNSNNATSPASRAIRVAGSLNNTFINNTGTAGGIGIFITTDSRDNDFINDTFTGDAEAVYLDSSSNNSFTGVNASMSNNAFYISNSSYNNITDCKYINGSVNDVYFDTTPSSLGNIFLNCSYDIDKENVQSSGQIIRKWYYMAYVNDSVGSDLPDVNITAYNSTGSIQFTVQTNGAGQISRQEVTEYNNSEGTRSFYNNYTITANKSGYINDSNEFNFTITQNKVNDFFTLEQNIAPEIIAVYNSTEMTDVSDGLNEGPYATYVLLNLTAYDQNGFGNLDDSSVQVNFSLAGETSRLNTSCVLLADYDTDYANYTCNVTMWWWDGPGTWSINASIDDLGGDHGFNDSTTFAIGPTTGFLANSTTVDWPDISPGATNIEALSSMLLNNTGNQQINVEINATNLTGEDNPAYELGASNFSVHTAPGCGGTVMRWYQYTTVAGAAIPKGNYSLDDGTAQETIYFCLEESNANLISQAYSTRDTGVWTIRIFLAVVTVGGAGSRRRKKKGKRLENDKLLKAINLVAEELKEEYSSEKEQIVKLLVKEVKKKYRVNNKEISELIVVRKDIGISLDVFNNTLGALEALSKYMKENLNMTYSEIARKLGRNERTIWTAYKKAVKKQSGPIKIREDTINIPLEVFENERLTVLEAIIIYLKEKGKKYSEIGKLLNRDQRNVWTIYSKAIDKK